ncbi:carboxylating nicotinate-nucleotide diphosphorylase [Lentimicrobium sp.]|jgi:nicotinate-nucleotide pyrophosphorylase (carboxylating)|uniref:carboxylating nicotinate-nucleotide diphosphorylase n=1 Tax=Lentimicrobium sp. TaxID=2034841 RepID=UPI0025FADE24|nr:carboxylating nicotinate-nucleotide diphosphorylase [Lentimicrobium sp.]MCO5256401.1 carboxylating nicotinate-nucleotide diphosphorylase [Lentimicrobium sp.]MCO5264157.1 carboxylating nicotinate-nucleotide diphosphorylase [Lentimicrobium sp.]HOP13188.1 carboxylating nicotinate-nucleotide diphosphorylase [Lentimicrobium sp.]HPF63768.1 carboxylating nicotinate-nucleotide diphosphorylase [Lentimicrobium sp.]HPJ63656.1 carboxylating nicotinate-nucleotide diphosphorylase [Lentimicrobium sp.]
MLTIDEIIANALTEDIGDGDHTSLSTIPEEATGKAKLLVKQEGVLSGMEIAARVFAQVDPRIIMYPLLKDGDVIKPGDIAFTVEGPSVSILKAERLALNFMQRMSGIATITAQYVERIRGTRARILDTRKTTPLMRAIEKMAVKHGGGHNHRFGLYDMIMIKDNHVDFAGGIAKAIHAANKYLKNTGRDLQIEIEVRNFDELRQVLESGEVNRIMLDNFSPENLRKAVEMIGGKYETEASGGITLETIRQYAETQVDFISVGALTHQIKSLDLSLKAF